MRTLIYALLISLGLTMLFNTALKDITSVHSNVLTIVASK